MKYHRPILLVPSIALAAVSCGNRNEQARPNILLIVADDLGLGDVSAYGSETISTPNIDNLAENGIRFTNGYATSATSTPSRYAMFTGFYPWRNADAKILPGDAPLLIPVDIATLPKMMQEEGYATAAIGKWHLGMGDGNVDWNKEISPSANTVGFDYTCLIAATNDRVPTVYVENGLVEGLDPDDPIYVSYEKNFEGEPTALTNPEMLKMNWLVGHNCSIVNGIPRIGYMKGGEKAKWVDEDMADYFVGKVKSYIDNLGDEPFFLYYGLHQPHVPRAPHARFVGKSTSGPRGDAVIEADWCVGEVIAYLEEKGLMDNTLVIFTSDNGPVLNDGYDDMAEELADRHDPRNGTRGGKYSLFDGGTHIPLIFYWKDRIKPGVSDALVSQLDFFASIGALVGGNVPEGIDSRNTIDVFLGKSSKGRKSLIHEAEGRLALRSGDYTMIPPYDGPERNYSLNELGNLPSFALFNMKKDYPQLNDIASEEPEKLEQMKEEFCRITGLKFIDKDGEVELCGKKWFMESTSGFLKAKECGDTLELFVPGGLTMWYTEELSGNYEINYRIAVIDEGGQYDRLSDMNCFWAAGDPENPGNIFAKAEWRDGDFSKYNTLELFYAGYGGNHNTTTRFRKYHPEYVGIDEEKVKPILREYTDPQHLLSPGRWYDITIAVKDNATTFCVDGEELFRQELSEGEGDGHFALRLLENHVKITGMTLSRS